MDGALAIATVTAALQVLLNNGLAACPVGGVKVGALPPDRVPVGNDEPSQINLFMYRVAPYTALGRNEKPLAAKLVEENNRSSRLALELNYLLTAYGAEEFHAEILLGSAMKVLAETPVLQAESLRKATARLPTGGTGKAGKLKETEEVQVEQLKITPQFLSFEDMSKLWSALQARYRPSVVYQVSAVIISGNRS